MFAECLVITQNYRCSVYLTTISSWNNLPFGIEKVDSVEGFKLKLKEHTIRVAIIHLPLFNKTNNALSNGFYCLPIQLKICTSSDAANSLERTSPPPTNLGYRTSSSVSPLPPLNLFTHTAMSDDRSYLRSCNVIPYFTVDHRAASLHI